MTAKLIPIVVGYDFSASAAPALRRAIAIAARAPFHVLHIACAIDPHAPNPAVPHRGRITYEYAEQVQRTLTDAIADELRAAEVEGKIQLHVHARIGGAAEEILALAQEVGAELVIVGSRGHGAIEQALLGSVAAKVMRGAHCTVEIAKPSTYPHVDLLQVREVEATHRYVAPHRYTYDQTCALLRPDEWPLY